MRKIYPLPFNKFAVLVLYGLLSIAVITLAQDKLPNCNSPQLVPSKIKQVTIGYVQLNAMGKIPWESYDYINIIAYPKDNVRNDIYRPKDAKTAKKVLKPLENLKKPPTAKVLLSIRNYDPTEWPDNEDDYGVIIDQTTKTIQEYNLDGVDIEYPGMRGFICHDGFGPAGLNSIWNKGRDDAFVGFIGKLRAGMDNTKTIMLTVGSDVIGDHPELNDNIKFLNIETYHYSLYENLRTPNPDPFVKSNPNAPFNIFTAAQQAWTTVGKIGKEKIIMGVDFGNTIQAVSDPRIKTSQTIDFASTQELQQIDIKTIDENINIINSLCSGDIDLPAYNKLRLYSWPWKYLSASALDQVNCKAKNGFTIQTPDQTSLNPWLIRDDSNPTNPNLFYYVSYENIDSLINKSNYSIGGSIAGMSVSDISYDDGSLLNVMQAIRGYEPKDYSSGGTTTIPGAGNAGNAGSGSPSSSPAESTKVSEPIKGQPRTGAIIGGVFGSLIGLVILGACGFYFYRYRGRPKSASFRSLLKFKGFPNSGNHVISRNPEMTTEPTPNLFAPPTTVIPVASGYVTAMFDFTGKEENDLSFKKGDKIEVLERGDGPNDWWVGRVNGAVGEFPGNYVKET